MNVDNLIELFLDYSEKVKRYSQNTINSYRADLNEFAKFCASKNVATIDQISEKKIKLYLMSLNEKGTGKRSISRKLATIRGLFKFAFEKEQASSNPASYLKNPKIEKKLPEITTVDNILEIYKLVQEAEENPLKIIVIFELLYGCSLRVGELCNIKLSDINLQDRSLRITGKGGKERIVPVGDKSIEIIKKYLEVNPPANQNDLLIKTKNGNKIYPKYVYRIVNKYLSKVTDLKRKSPHILRHSSATHMLDNGADLSAVKEILGHENLSTTQVYTHVSIDRLKSTYKKSHPKS